MGAMKNKRGGKREGAGRPKLKDSEKKEPTIVKRVPISKLDEFIELMKAVRTLPIKKK